MNDISGCETFKVAQVPITMNFPRTSKYNLPAGVTKIEVKTRKVTLPDGSTVEMYTPVKINTCKSFLIYTNTDFDMKVTLNGVTVLVTSGFPLWTRSKLVEFDEIEITTTAPTVFYIAMSNIEDGVALIDPITNIATRHVVSTDPLTNFTDALITNVTENENISIVGSKMNITKIAIISAQSLNYRLAFYSDDSFSGLKFIGNIDFDLPTEGFLLNSYYCMDVHDMSFDYVDSDDTDELHIQLINLDATAKTAGTAGLVKFYAEYGEQL